MNEAQTQLLDTPYPQIFHVLPLYEDIPLILDILPNDYLHECGLTGAVLSAKCMYLSACHLKVQLL